MLVPIGVLVGLGSSRVLVMVSHYIEHRERVRFSALHAVWTCALLLMFVGLADPGLTGGPGRASRPTRRQRLRGRISR